MIPADQINSIMGNLIGASVHCTYMVYDPSCHCQTNDAFASMTVGTTRASSPWLVCAVTMYQSAQHNLDAGVRLSGMTWYLHSETNVVKVLSAVGVITYPGAVNHAMILCLFAGGISINPPSTA